MFIDIAKIYIKAGPGGCGCNSFYRDKYQREGIPDGGDGGNGADIIIKADQNLRTLLDFQYKRHFYGRGGGNGSGKQKRGRDAEPVIIHVPCGTLVEDPARGLVLRDLDTDAEEFLVARGGKGGLGNRHRRQATPGEVPEEKGLLLNLKLIADVGVVGFPNAGKSTLISHISNAHPKIAAYPFTTKFPVLGVVKSAIRAFVIVDIPGLIQGSCEGKGLGDKFLRHVERTRILIHLIDMAGYEGRDPVEDYKILLLELKKYSAEVYKKPRIAVANKMDLEGAQENLSRFKKLIGKKVYPISALNKEGLEELIEQICRHL